LVYYMREREGLYYEKEGGGTYCISLGTESSSDPQRKRRIKGGSWVHLRERNTGGVEAI